MNHRNETIFEIGQSEPIWSRSPVTNGLFLAFDRSKADAMFCNAMMSYYSLFGNPEFLLGKSNLCPKYSASQVPFPM